MLMGFQVFVFWLVLRCNTSSLVRFPGGLRFWFWAWLYGHDIRSL